jgi:transmembrane sensor
MRERESSRDIDNAAAAWAARLDRAPLSPDTQRELERWTAADPRRLGALARAMAVSVAFEAAMEDVDEALVPPRLRVADARAVNRRRFFQGGVAAVGGLSIAGGAWTWAAAHEFHTRKGEVRSVRLKDGSIVRLNTDSSVWVMYGGQRRYVSLRQGEALFEVAKDSTRPFVVRAGGIDVRAVGTSFSVSRIPGRKVEVLVEAGLVDMAAARDRVGEAVRLTAGCHAVAEQFGQVTVTNPGTEAVSRALSWRRGMLNFEGVTLAEAAATFARYSDERIVLDSPEVSQLTVTGLFASGDPAGFARAAATSLNLRVRRVPDGVRLSR